MIKVAEAEKITTLNINDLALAVRNEFLPGEKIKLKILEKGSGRAIIALTRKMARIVFAILNNRTAFDPSRMYDKPISIQQTA